MSDTPETDADEFPVMTWPARDHPMAVRSTLARKLERDRIQYARDLSDLMAEYDDRKSQWGNEYMWEKHEDAELIEGIRARIKSASIPPAEK